MKKLNDLTPNEKNSVFVPGTIIAYSDMSNPLRKATITKIGENKWGRFANIAWWPTETDRFHEERLDISAGFQNGWVLVEIAKNNVIFIKTAHRNKMGKYSETLLDASKKMAEILLESVCNGRYTIKTKDNVIVSGNGVKKSYGNGNYEVTEKKLNELKNQYTFSCNF